MSREQRLSQDHLRDLIDEKRLCFGDDYVPLSTAQSTSIKTCSDLVTDDPTSWPRNSQKKRARTILIDVWTHSSELFVLVALSVTPTKLGTLKSNTYLQELLKWWQSVPRQKGLQELVDRHSDILPPRKEISRSS
ncbi:hypothetical protein T440DRAFT_284832 [Plenodomus tracheiphilus IPT5]|uniref:Uncharacterized protein n=1 Tax=Plenodomus tracheiphilus IPT5 TaxID=1408161 RepID=A0A6A7AP45_9PLEO|nr:hypothetical protein T440DRAFT_284832 [Plenodomus tracheiphilus IPT5]